MGAYQITGGRPLRGDVPIHGAKNSVLPILAGTLLAGGPCTIHNCPQIADVETAVQILRSLGAAVERRGDVLCVDTAQADGTAIPPALMKRMRAAVIFLGPLLGRFGKADFSMPGGCPLGERPIDLHLRGLRLMGAQIGGEHDDFHCTAGQLKGCTIALPLPSVGATENLMLAALCCRGETVLCNAAREPEIVDLADFLRACGGEIHGAGSGVIRITGGRPLHGCEFTVMPDRMEAATYLAAAAATRGDLTLRGARSGHLTAVLEVLERAGCRITAGTDWIRLRSSGLRAVSPIRTAPYDGFPTDAQAPVMAAMALAEGNSLFEETIFSDRFCHVGALCAMGAQICAARRVALVRGVERLHGAQVCATDLRGGAAITIAALCAAGESSVLHTEHMERGYADFVQILRGCGAEIREYTYGTEQQDQSKTRPAPAELPGGPGGGAPPCGPEGTRPAGESAGEAKAEGQTAGG